MKRPIFWKNTGAVILFAAFFMWISSCADETYTPKPRGYFRIDFPEKKYTRFDSADYPYHFDYPVYAEVKKDRNRISEPYWVNLTFEDMNAKLHITYHKLENNLPELSEDARKFAYKHSIKADAIKPKEWVNPEKDVYGILYRIKGNAASTLQFYLTDSAEHFMRASFYFELQPNKDSLAPAQQFIDKDLERLIESFEWNPKAE